LIGGLLARIPGVTLSGHPTERMPGHASFIVEGVEAEGMLIGLDLAGIAASSGSACASGAATPSHVLTAMGYGQQEALGALRLTLGRASTDADIDAVLDVLPGIISRLRAA
jgi:cysteine desulfurase